MNRNVCFCSKMMKKQLIVITSYPDSRTGIKHLNAVAWHAAKTLKRLSESCHIVCLAERIPGSPTTRYVNNNLKVYRSYTKGSPIALFQTLPLILRNAEIKNVLIQFEFNIFGGFLPVISMPLFLLLLKILGKNITIEIHQVVPDISVLKNHLNVHTKALQLLFSAGLRVFYRAVGLLTDTVIVLEEQLKTRLSAYIPVRKIYVVPLSAAARVAPDRAAAKKALGIPADQFTIIVFGFVNWYKGSDWVVDALSAVKSDRIGLILAGGKNPTLNGRNHYESFYSKVKKRSDASTNCTLTGFIGDAQVPLYFGAADVVVLPYRVFMSASGPFSWALSYKKPVLLSKSLAGYRDSEDFNDAMEQAELSASDLFFSSNKQAFVKRIQTLSTDPRTLNKHARFAAALAARRNESEILKQYSSYIFDSTVQPAGRPAWRTSQP